MSVEISPGLKRFYLKRKRQENGADLKRAALVPRSSSLTAQKNLTKGNLGNRLKIKKTLEPAIKQLQHRPCSI